MSALPPEGQSSDAYLIYNLVLLRNGSEGGTESELGDIFKMSLSHLNP